MRRLPLLVPLLLLPLSACAASAEEQTADDAGDKARRVSNVLYSWADRSPQDIGHRASELDEVEVMKLGGTPRKARVTIRVKGHGSEGAGWMDPGEPVTLPYCFELKYPYEWDTTPDRVDCPKTATLTFGPWPKDPEIPYERLRRALLKVPSTGTVSEAKVRAAIATLDLDPAITTEFRTEDSVVGVSLRVKPYLGGALDCTLARVAPGRTHVWIPPRIQRMPGEAGCDANNALHPLPPPH